MKNQSIENLKIPNNFSKKYSFEFKKFFLLQFTKQLIVNSAPQEIFKLERILEEKKKQKLQEHPEEIEHEKIKEKFEKSNLSKQKVFSKPLIKRKNFPFEHISNARLTIPESRFPERLRYIQPVPMKKEIDLDDINPLIQDPFVEIIECYGPEQNILVSGKMGTKKTRITLTKEEIDKIIKKVSETTKIPASEGIFKVAVGRLIFMAIISEVIGSKFLIKKMMYAPKIQGRI